MQPEQAIDNTTDFLIVQNEQWGLAKADADLPALSRKAGPGNSLVLYLIWLPEEDMPQEIESACKTLETEVPYFPGFHFKFATTPSPGFIITVKKGWEPAHTQQYRELLSRIAWEINRIVRS